MGISKCNNGTLEGTEHYSSPVPWIGLYIAAASLVCMLLMIYDITAGFLSRRRWLPCKMFQLNSVTLTVLSVVVKLPVDLTTPMPTSLDQLSKLSGTTFLCIYMCYIMPSLGVMKDWSNMYALSILVFTVFVNICIQISTGVIILFIPEHILILCCLLLLLLILWNSALTARGLNRNALEKCKSYFKSGTRGGTSFMQRLKVTYLYSLSFSPQFASYKFVGCHAGGVLSVVCSVGLIWASMVNEGLCLEASDYQWSMKAIVVIQILGVITGSFASFFRVITMLHHGNQFVFSFTSPEEPYDSNPIWTEKSENLCFIAGRLISELIIMALLVIAFVVPLGILWAVFACMMSFFFEKKQKNIHGFEDLIYEGDMGFEEWTLHKCVEEMKRTIKAIANEAHVFPSPESALSSVFLSHIAHCTGNTYERPRPRDLIEIHGAGARTIPLRLLPLVLLVRIAQVSLPKEFSQQIVLALKEVFEILCFIEKYSSGTIFEHVKETEVAKAVWKASGFEDLLYFSTFYYSNSDRVPLKKLYDSNLDRANAIMAELPNTMPPDIVGTEISFLVDFIKGRNCSSVQALYNFIQDLFVDSLDGLLAQLPRSIFNAVYGSPAGEFEERVRLSLMYLCKFETWNVFSWEPPEECNCSSLLPTTATEAPNAVPQIGTQQASQHHEGNANGDGIIEMEWDLGY